MINKLTDIKISGDREIEHVPSIKDKALSDKIKEANAKLDKMVVTNKRKKGRVRFLSGVLKKASNA